MIVCPAIPAEGPGNVATALKSVDCLSGQAVEIAFGRLFGSSGSLGQILTLALTLYVAIFALSLLTGRASLRVQMLTPRMLQVGLVLTFATSWVAYQNVGWNLLTGAPDQIAGALLGTTGSATQIFANRLDGLFDVIANSARLASMTVTQQTAPAIALPGLGGPPQPATLLWAASLLLLLGTVGVLIVAKIALAAVMGLGPVFIICTLFKGTRGLFEGWVRAAVMLALTPMLAVILGGGVMVLILPMIRTLENAGGKVSLELATSIFLAAVVYVALMILAMRAAAMMTKGWHIGGGTGDRAPVADSPDQPVTVMAMNGQSSPAPETYAIGAGAMAPSDRLRTLLASVDERGGTYSASDRRAANLAAAQGVTVSNLPSAARDPRLRPLGQGFRAPNHRANRAGGKA